MGRTVTTEGDGQGAATPPESTPETGKPSEPTIADVLTRLDKIEADTAGRNKQFVADLAKIRRKVAGEETSPPPKDKPDEPAPPAGPSTQDVESIVEYRVGLATLEADDRAQVEEMHQQFGPGAAVGLIRALKQARDGATPPERKPARPGTGAQPKAPRSWKPEEVWKLPPEDRGKVIARIRRGEDSFEK